MSELITTNQILLHIDGINRQGANTLINIGLISALRVGNAFAVPVDEYLNFIARNPHLKLTNEGRKFIESMPAELELSAA